MKTKTVLPLGQLLRKAASCRPDIVFGRLGLAAEDAACVSVGELDERADRHSAHWLAAGLGEGARVALVATPEPDALAAIAGATRVGIEVALVSPALDAATFAAGARAASALAIAGPAEFGGLDIGGRLARVAAAAPSVAAVALWGGDRPNVIRLDDSAPLLPAYAPPECEAGLSLIAPPVVSALDGPSLHAIAGDLTDAAGIEVGAKVVSLVSLASPAGLICGAYAPLIAGAHVLWQAPFSARCFQDSLERLSSVHLVAPGAIVAELGDAGLLTPDRIESLTLITNGADFDPIFDHDLEPDRVFTLHSHAPRLVKLARTSSFD